MPGDIFTRRVIQYCVIWMNLKSILRRVQFVPCQNVKRFLATKCYKLQVDTNYVVNKPEVIYHSA